MTITKSLILLLVSSISAKRLFVGLNNAKYYYNYRMVSNLLAVSSKLQVLGIGGKNALTGNHVASFNHFANFPPNTQRFEDNEPKKNLLTSESSFDFFNEDVSLRRHLMAISGRFDWDDPLNKRLDFRGAKSYFVYFTGHGGDLYMKIKYLEIFFARHFSDFFEDLFVSRKVPQAFVISDTCSAGTLFTTLKKDLVNAIFFGSSEWDSYSVSLGFDHFVGQPIKDRFSYHFVKHLEVLAKNGGTMTHRQMMQKFDKSLIESTPLAFNYMKSNPDININEFFQDKPEPIVFDGLKNQQKEIDDLFDN